MIEVLRNRTYRALFGAQVIALVGTGLLTVALGLLAFDLAGEAAGSVLGTALTIKMVAYVGVAPLMAALVDRLPKKAVLVGADVLRLAIAVTLPFVTETWQIYVLVFVLQSASATFTPAFQSLIPTVLPDSRDYTRALALSRLAYDLEALLSPILAAALLTVVAYNNLFLGTAVGFAASATLVLIAAIPAHPGGSPQSTFWQRLPEGVRVFARTPTLRFLALANVVVAAGTALVLVNSVVYVKAVLGLDDAALALTLGAYGVGSLAVALNIPRLVDRFGVIRTMRAGLVVVVIGLAATSVITLFTLATGIGWWAVIVAWAVLGAGSSLILTPSARLLADASTSANRNLVYTAQFALSHACFLVTYPLAGWIGAANLAAAAVVLAVLALAAAVIASMTRAARDARRHDSMSGESAASER
ncbi:MFS transporter [Microbacterium thalassium]|uniref:MFS family permease n=1 Tax=Microbacterium thalassium TaxID=362649 RepID=A0A7X0FT57_9MICO|nr:MFS transporter [Microbacterium thalassium]MBB6392531.1 MFS family permease [Microbacterium thalassium]GLK23238.1 MFS transporter [Microbacterium thalassium]